MRDCLFFVADSNMEFAIRGFLERDGVFQAIGCRPFSFDAQQDMAVARGQNDPGLYTRAKELIQPYRATHQRIVIAIDEEWEGSPGLEKIKERLMCHILEAGWTSDTGCVIVASPEADNWIWADSPHAASALGWEAFADIKAYLNAQGLWPEELTKPPRPKEALEKVLRFKKKPRSSSVYGKISSSVSIKKCTDPSVTELIMALRAWFPFDKND